MLCPFVGHAKDKFFYANVLFTICASVSIFVLNFFEVPTVTDT